MRRENEGLSPSIDPYEYLRQKTRNPIRGRKYFITIDEINEKDTNLLVTVTESRDESVHWSFAIDELGVMYAEIDQNDEGLEYVSRDEISQTSPFPIPEEFPLDHTHPVHSTKRQLRGRKLARRNLRDARKLARFVYSVDTLRRKI